MAFAIETRLGVAAPAEVVWAILSDIEGWPRWAPMYAKASGVLRIGETVAVDFTLPGEAPETIAYSVLDWAPDMQIHLRSKLYRGLLSTTRYLEIEALSPQSCIFSNGELFGGVMAGFMPKRLRRAFRQGFVEAAEHLKARAEANWAGKAKL
jgi:hypothetical protein